VPEGVCSKKRRKSGRVLGRAQRKTRLIASIHLDEREQRDRVASKIKKSKAERRPSEGRRCERGCLLHAIRKRKRVESP